MSWYLWLMLLFGASGAAASIVQVYKWIEEQRDKKRGGKPAK